MLDKEQVVLFRTQGNLMLCTIEDDLMILAKKDKFIKLLAPRVCVISGDPQAGMQLTLVPYGVMSSKTFLNDNATNENYYVMFNSEMIEAEIPKEFLSNQIINAYIGTLTTAEVPTLSKENIPELKNVDMGDLVNSVKKE